MAIRRYNLHPKGSPEDIIYPATDIGQVEGLNDALDKKADKSDVYTKDLVYTKSEVFKKDETYSRTAINNLLSGKADKADTYTKDNTYNKTEVDNALALKADKTDTYTKAQVDNALALKANADNVYTKEEVVANPSDESSGNLTKLKIGNTTYGISGGSGGSRLYKHIISLTINSHEGVNKGYIILKDVNEVSIPFTAEQFKSKYCSGGYEPFLCWDDTYTSYGTGYSPSAGVFSTPWCTYEDYEDEQGDELIVNYDSVYGR